MNPQVTEHFITLSLNPESGRYQVLGNYLTYGVVGAMLMDLSLDGRISLEGHNVIAGKDISSTGIPAFDMMLKTISDASRQRNLKAWIRRLGNRAGWYRKEMQKYFVDGGLLKGESKRFLCIPYRLHYVAKPGYRKNLATRYKEIILYNKVPDDHEIMVIGLIFACKMHRLISRGGEERRKVRAKTVEIIKDNKYANDVNKAIMEVQAAITASIAATAAMSAATSASN